MNAETGHSSDFEVDFFGSHTMSMDRTQRVLFPSKLMEVLKGGFPDHNSTLRVYITDDRDTITEDSPRKPIKYLQIMPIPVYRYFLKQAYLRGLDAKTLNPFVEEVEIDEFNRIRFNNRLIEHLGVDPKSKVKGANSVVFQGNTESVLVYGPEDYKRHLEVQAEDVHRRFKAAARTGSYTYGRKAQ